MYWPIGAPRVYAAGSSKSPTDRVLEFDDDAESRETTEGSGSLVEAPNVGPEGRGDGEYEPASGLSTPITPITPGIKPVEHDTQRRLSNRFLGQDPSFARSVDKEPLLGLKISRTGHLFAVITATSLTIWQTKVGCSMNFKVASLTLITADGNISYGGSVQEILERLRPKRFPPRSPRLCDFCGSDYIWLFDHIHFGN